MAPEIETYRDQVGYDQDNQEPRESYVDWVLRQEENKLNRAQRRAKEKQKKTRGQK